MKHIFTLALVLIILPPVIRAQEISKTSYNTEVFGSAATGSRTPFWMVSQTWGLVPLNAGNAYIRGGISHEQKWNNDWSYEIGVDLVASTRHSYNTIWLQQAYGEISWKKWNLRIGPKQKYTSFLNEHLSSGDFVLSNNARPIPEINISLNDFTPIPFTKNKIYLRGDFALGKLYDAKYVENIAIPNGKEYFTELYSHHKSLYFRIGNFEKDDKSRLTFGIQHFAFFNGHGYYDSAERSSHVNFSELLRTILTAKEGGPDEAGEVKYKTGSHFGSYIVKYDYRSNKSEYSVYWHHFIEDGSSAGPQSIRDMLLGVEYKSEQKKLLSGAVLEYVYTKNQSGSVHFNHGVDEAHADLFSKGNGMDDYYNNVQYIEGPSYYGRSFGTPLLLSPEYNTDGTVNFKSSRIIAFHGAIEGYFSNNLSYRLRATYGETWGRYKVPFLNVRKGIASSFDLTYQCPKSSGLELKLTTGFNNDSFFDQKSLGAGFSIIKRGLIAEK